MWQGNKGNRMKADRVLILFIPAFLALVHILLCIYSAVNSAEGWEWILVTAIDFPFSILVLQFLHDLSPLISFGGFWHYVVVFIGMVDFKIGY
jgi:hypothetical protein